MFPLSDDNPTVRTPWMTYVIIGVTLACWFVLQHAGFGEGFVASVCELGLVPAELTHARPIGFAVPLGNGVACAVDGSAINWLTPLITIFLHGSWSHLLGNLWFFWVFGNNIEDSMGPARFVVFYLLCGLLASATHVALNPASAIPTVGASGAISGIMGAYVLLFPRVRVNLLFFFAIFIRVIPVPAWVALLGWFGLQIVSALPALSGSADVGGVAFAAHIGGFVAGAVMIKAFADAGMLARRRAIHAAHYPHIQN